MILNHEGAFREPAERFPSEDIQDPAAGEILGIFNENYIEVVDLLVKN